MKSRLSYSILMCGLCFLMSMRAMADEVVPLIFHVPFEKSIKPTNANGSKEAKNLLPLQYTEGKKGSALLIGNEEKPKFPGAMYEADGNIMGNKGSIELWISPLEKSMDRVGRFYFSTENRSVTIWGWVKKIRFDFNFSKFKPKKGVRRYLQTSIRKWEPGVWHHVVCTWNVEKGVIQMFIDGQLAEKMTFPAKVISFTGQKILIGATKKGRFQAGAALDELKIYATDLSDAQVLQAYADKLPVSLKKMKKPAIAKKIKPKAISNKKEKLLFYASFNKDTVADTAQGNPTPAVQKKLKIVKGLNGNSVKFEGRQSQLAYPELKNMERDEGTISFWCKTGKGFKNYNWPSWFGESPSGMVVYRIYDSLKLETERGDHYVKSNIVTTWRGGEWHHFTIAWDKYNGATLFLDGNGIRNHGTNDVGHNWQTKINKNFYIGCAPGKSSCYGEIDEVKIFNKKLTTEKIKSLTWEYMPFHLKLKENFIFPDEKKSMVLQLFNMSNAPVAGKVSFEITEKKGTKVIKNGVHEFAAVPANDKGEITLPAPEKAGTYKLKATYIGKGSVSRVMLFYVAPIKDKKIVDSKKRLVDEIDCTADVGRDKFTADKETKVVNGIAGKYREGNSAPKSRFAYQLNIKNPGKPHILEIDYPDDKDRVCSIRMGENEYSLGLASGFLSGVNYHLTNKMQTQSHIIWPTGNKISLVFMTWVKDMPGAVSNIRLYESDTLLPLKAKTQEKTERYLGLYWEDPQLGCAFGGGNRSGLFNPAPFYKDIENLAAYLKYTGLNTIEYPLTWYYGSMYASRLEGFQTGAAYWRQPEGWVELMLKMAEKNDISFFGNITIQLPRYLENKRDELAGKDIYDGLKSIVQKKLDGSVGKKDWFKSTPIYNPLHPVVEKYMMNLVKEVTDQWGDSPAFKGLSIMVNYNMSTWFGDLSSGYSDYNIALFEKETGIKVPGGKKDPSRFGKRYNFLAKKKRKEWIQWRCKKIHALLQKVSKKLAEKRPDLKLYVNLWNHGQHFDEILNKEISFAESYRQGGIDFSLFKNDKNLFLRMPTRPGFYHQLQKKSSIAKRQVPLNNLDYFLNKKTFGGAPISMQINLPYFEDFSFPKRKMPERWCKLAFHCSAPSPSGRSFLKAYAFNMAMYDPSYIVAGGFATGNQGAAEYMREFSKAYLTLPKENFAFYKTGSDTVALRTLSNGKQNFFYLVNKMFMPLSVKFSLESSSAKIINLSSGKEVNPIKTEGKVSYYNIPLKAYQVASFKLADKFTVKSAEVDVSPALIAEIKKGVDKINAAYNKLAEKDKEQDNFIKRLQKAFGAKKYFLSNELLHVYTAGRIKK